MLCTLSTLVNKLQKMNIAQIKTNKQTKQTNIVNNKKQAVPAYDDNWSSCFNVPCKWYQAEEMRHCLWIFFDVVHWLSYYNRPCFVAFLLKKNMTSLFLSFAKMEYWQYCYDGFFFSNIVYLPLLWLFQLCCSWYLLFVRVVILQ